MHRPNGETAADGEAVCRKCLNVRFRHFRQRSFVWRIIRPPTRNMFHLFARRAAPDPERLRCQALSRPMGREVCTGQVRLPRDWPKADAVSGIGLRCLARQGCLGWPGCRTGPQSTIDSGAGPSRGTRLDSGAGPGCGAEPGRDPGQGCGAGQGHGAAVPRRRVGPSRATAGASACRPRAYESPKQRQNLAPSPPPSPSTHTPAERFRTMN